MHISVKINTDLAFAVAAKVLKKLPFAINNALTETGKQCVDAGRREIEKDFTIRKTFLAKRIQVLQYSRVSNLNVVVGINADVQGSPLLLGYFEEGGTRTPNLGPEIAVPLTGVEGGPRPSFPDPVAPAWKYPALAISAGKGKKRTFVIPNVGVFQRIGPGKEDIQLVYLFERSVELQKRTHLIDTFRATAYANWPANFKAAVIKEIGYRSKGKVAP